MYERYSCLQAIDSIKTQRDCKIAKHKFYLVVAFALSVDHSIAYEFAFQVQSHLGNIDSIQLINKCDIDL